MTEKCYMDKIASLSETFLRNYELLLREPSRATMGEPAAASGPADLTIQSATGNRDAPEQIS